MAAVDGRASSGGVAGQLIYGPIGAAVCLVDGR